MRVLLARALAVEAPSAARRRADRRARSRPSAADHDLLRALAQRGAASSSCCTTSRWRRFCDRLVLLAHGRMLADGPPDAVLTDATLAAAYGIEVQRGDGYVLPWTRLEKRP